MSNVLNYDTTEGKCSKDKSCASKRTPQVKGSTDNLIVWDDTDNKNDTRSCCQPRGNLQNPPQQREDIIPGTAVPHMAT